MERLTLVSEEKLLEVIRELEALEDELRKLRIGAELSQSLSRSMMRLEDRVHRLPVVSLRSLQKEVLSHIDALAERFQKRVELRFSSPDLHIASDARDVISEMIVHLVRNALDHGIETPEQREKSGKPPSGVIELQFRLSYSRLLMRFVDDGRGVDSETVLRKARQRNLINEEQGDPDRQAILNLLTEPQFSTKEEAGEISGRGVGLSAGASLAEDIGGKMQLLDSVTGGLEVLINLPLTRVGLPVVPAVGKDGSQYWLPDDLVYDLEKNWSSKQPFLLEKNKLNWDASHRVFRLFFMTDPQWQAGTGWAQLAQAFAPQPLPRSILAARASSGIEIKDQGIEAPHESSTPTGDESLAANLPAQGLAPLLDRELFHKFTTR